MIKTIANILIIRFLLSYFILFAISAIAIPVLAVTPGEPESGGVYFGPTPDLSSYQWVFADTCVEGTDGFEMPASGGDLSIWYGSNSGPPDSDTDIWLATTSASGGSFKYGGESFILNNNLTAASYKEDVYGLYSGTANNPKIGSWSTLTDGEFGAGKKEFYVLTDTIEYSNFLADDRMYAVTTVSGVTFSPETIAAAASAKEPAKMLLLGSGLIGFVVVWRKKFFKK